MMGLEPTAFCATNRRSNQLSYIRQNLAILPLLRRKIQFFGLDSAIIKAKEL